MRLGTLLAPDLKQLLKDDPAQVRALLDDIHAEDIADLIGELDRDEAAALLTQIPVEEAAPIFARLEEHEQEQLVAHLGIDVVAHIASLMAPDVRADFFSALPEAVADRILLKLESVDPEAAADVRAIEKWPETSAGHLMTTRYVWVPPSVTVATAVAAIRKHAERKQDENIYNVYAIGADKRIVGMAALRAIFLAPPDAPLTSVLRTNIISVPPEMDQEEVARRMAKYDLNVVPVIDGQGVLLGVITIDDIVDVLTQEQTEDVQKIGGVEPLDVPYFQTTFWTFIRKRGVWLVILFIEEFFTQTALRHYDPVLTAIKGSAYYVPLLISAGGNSGSQSSTLIIRGLSLGEIRLKDWWRIFLREAAMGLVLGVLLGTIAFGRVLMYPDQHANYALTIALTLVGIVTTGCAVGSMLPIIMRRLKIDPATSSTPFIASLVDVLGIIIFVHVAKVVMASVIARGH